jgi:ribosomal protein S18 acetylase RimI-like enzyme
MVIKGKSIIAVKDGVIEVRSLVGEDAREVLEATIKIAGETPYLAATPEERHITLEEEEQWILRANYSKDTVVLGAFYRAEDEDTCTYAGNIELKLKTNARRKHRADIGIALLQEYTDKGIGTALIENIKKVAKINGVEILSLSVMTTNIPALNCYMRQGFKIVGTEYKSIKYKDDTYGDMYIMQCEI